MYGYVPSTAPSAVSGARPSMTVVSDVRSVGGRSSREAEVEQLGPRRGQHHVGRFEVAMHQTAAMRVIERIGHLDGDA